MADQDDGSSIFSTLVSLAAGSAAGYQQFRKSKLDTSISGSSILDPRTSVLSRIQKLNVENLLSGQLKKYQTQTALSQLDRLQQRLFKNREKHLGNINDLLTSVNAGPIDINNRSIQTTQLIRREWEAAVQSNFVNPLEAKVFASSDDPLSAIKATLQTNQSLQTQRAFQLFHKNVNVALNLGLEAPVPLVAISNFIKDTPEVNIFQKVNLGGITDNTIRSTLESIQQEIGRPLTISRRGYRGEGEFAIGILGQQDNLFNLPEAFATETGKSAGLIRSGTELQNIYAPGVFGLTDISEQLKEELTYPQLKARRILETIQANKLKFDSPDLSQKIKSIQEDVFKFARYMEPNISGTGYSPETIFRAHQMAVLDSEYKPITGQTRRNFVQKMYQETGGSFTPGSGDVSRFSLFNEEEIYGPFAAEQDYARKPWQRIRQYTPTESALKANLASPFGGQEFNYLDSPMAIKQFKGPSGARVKTLYLSEEQLAILGKNGITIGDGELLLHEAVKEKLQVARTKRVTLNQLNSDVVSLLMNRGYKLENLTAQTGFPNIPVEGILGRAPEGSLIKTKYPTELIGLSPSLIDHVSGTKQAGLDLITRETIDMTNAEKVFGSLKGMARFIKSDEIMLEGVLKKAGIEREHLAGVQAIARGSDIKDTARLKQAMIGNWLIQKRGGPSSEEIITSIKGLSIPKTEEYFQSLATQFGGTVFNPAAGGVSVSQLHFGGMKELTGAGNIGTLEPRIFNLLAGSNPGGLAEEINNEILSRMIGHAPGKAVIHQELMNTLKSVTGEFSPTAKSFIVGKTDSLDREKLIELSKRGGFIETGLEKIPRVYIPGSDQVPELQSRMVSTGTVIAGSEPAKIYRDMLYDISAFNRLNSPLTEQELLGRFEQANTGYLTRLFQEAALAGKGAGTLARGEVPGSRALTALSEINAYDQGAFSNQIASLNIPQEAKFRTIGLPIDQAEDMFAELSKFHPEEKVAGMKARFNSGEVIAGMLGRHPTIDPYSLQPVLFKSIKTNDPVVLIPEEYRPINFPTSTGILTKQIQQGVAPGLGLDKDADTAISMLLSPQMEEKMRNQLLSQESVLSQQLSSYQDHSIRMQLLKPKAQGTGASVASYAQQRAAETTKLAMTSEQVGLLSTQLTKARTAITASSIPAPRKLKALSLLTWLEQTPISGKHLDVSQALTGAFEQQLQAVKEGVRGSPQLLQGAITSMTEGTVNPSLMSLFHEGLTTTEGRKVEGFALGQTSEDIVSSIRSLRELPLSDQFAASVKYSAPSSGTSINLSNLTTAIQANELKPAVDNIASHSRSTIAALNREVAKTTGKIKPFIKPTVIGLGVAGLTAAILSPSPGILPPPPPSGGSDRVASQPTNTTRDDVEMPQAQQLGNPTTQPQMQQSAVSLDSGGHERRKGLRAQIQANSITEGQRQSIINRLNNRYPSSQLNITMKDDRAILNPHKINDMLD